MPRPRPSGSAECVAPARSWRKAEAWSTCRPEQVAIAALLLYDAPSAGEAEKRQIEAWVAEAVQKRPDATLLASKLGVIWVRQGRFDEAEALCRRVLAGNPDNAGR